MVKNTREFTARAPHQLGSLDQIPRRHRTLATHRFAGPGLRHKYRPYNTAAGAAEAHLPRLRVIPPTRAVPQTQMNLLSRRRRRRRAELSFAWATALVLLPTAKQSWAVWRTDTYLAPATRPSNSITMNSQGPERRHPSQRPSKRSTAQVHFFVGNTAEEELTNLQ